MKTELTLRQIEVIRAVMMTGTVAGAAQMLGVSAPGISRLLRHAEDSLGLRLFERKAGLFVPAVEAERVFDQIGAVYKNVENLQAAVAGLQQGRDVRLSFASAPSIAQFIASRALRDVRRRFPELFIDLNILKIEEVADYLLLERGEFVIMSSRVDSAGVETAPVASGRLVAIAPDGHRLAGRASVSVRELAEEDLVGVDPGDPYGAILMRPFEAAGLSPRHAMRGRFAQTVISLVRHGLGVAVIDEFSVAEVWMPGLSRIEIEEETEITAWVARKKGRALSSFADYAVGRLRRELERAATRRDWQAGAAPGQGARPGG